MQQPSLIDPTYRIPVTAPWMPPACRHLAGRRHTLRLSRAEKKIYRKPVRIPISQWAEKYRILTMSSIQGRWHNEVTPYLTGIMDAAGEPFVRTIVVCKAPQIGGTEIAHNFIGAAIDQDPGPVLYVFPDEKMSDENSRDRVLPMIQQTPRLRRYLTRLADDQGRKRINLQHMPIYFGWATSPSRLGNKPIKHLILDEVDKYPPLTSKKEASPIALAKKRTNTYPNTKKTWEISTPTKEGASIIWQDLQDCEAVYAYYVRCPACGEFQVMEFEQIKWPEDVRDPKILLKGQTNTLVHYHCRFCSAAWDDAARNRAVRAGEWREVQTGKELSRHLQAARPHSVGFHLPSWLSYFISLRQPAAAFLKGLNDPVALRDFKNNHAAEPWTVYTKERHEDVILKLRDDRPRGLLPPVDQIAALTISIDTQDNGFWYEVRAWGYGIELTSWQVREGFAEEFAALGDRHYQGIIYQEYQDANGNKMNIEAGVIDTGGHRTVEVYDWSRRHRHILPIKGQRKQARLVNPSKQDHYPGTSKAIPGGLILYNLNVTLLKDRLAAKLQIPLTDPGAWRLHSEASEDYARQLCAEYRDEDSGFWENPRQRPNHFWDVGVYSLGLVIYRQVQFRAPPVPETKKKTKNKSTTAKKGRW